MARLYDFVLGHLFVLSFVRVLALRHGDVRILLTVSGDVDH